MTLEEKVDQAASAIHRIERQQELTIRALQLIMEELGIRAKLVEIAEMLETRNGSDAPVSTDIDQV